MINRSEIRANDILIAITGDIGKVGLVPAEIRRGNINQHTARVRVSRDYDPYFVYTYLCTNRLQQSFQLIKTGLSMPQLSLTQIRAIELPSVDIQEQRQIGTVFASLDNLIALHLREPPAWLTL
jgi:type I restriction enzyme S subunit